MWSKLKTKIARTKFGLKSKLKLETKLNINHKLKYDTSFRSSKNCTHLDDLNSTSKFDDEVPRVLSPLIF